MYLREWSVLKGEEWEEGDNAIYLFDSAEQVSIGFVYVSQNPGDVLFFHLHDDSSVMMYKDDEGVHIEVENEKGEVLPSLWARKVFETEPVEGMSLEMTVALNAASKNDMPDGAWMAYMQDRAKEVLRMMRSDADSHEIVTTYLARKG